MKKFSNFLCVSFSVLWLLTLGAQSAIAQNYPNKTVKLINSFPPGGPSDVIARSLAESLQNSLKQPFIV